jgi:hypothetical protein
MLGEAENGDHLKDVMLKHLATTQYMMPILLPPGDCISCIQSINIFNEFLRYTAQSAFFLHKMWHISQFYVFGSYNIHILHNECTKT